MKKVYHIYNSKFKVKKSISLSDPVSSVLWLLSCGFCLLSLLWLLKALFLGFYPDFNTQYYVSKLLFSGINPYLGGSNLFTPQTYPPTVSFFYLLFSLFPIVISSYIFSIFSLLALVASLFFLSRIVEVRFFSGVNLFLMGMVFMMFPVKFTLGMGQINIFVLWLLVISLWFLKQKKECASGIFLGVSFAMKLFPILLPVYFLIDSGLRRNDNGVNKKVLLGFFISLLISVLLVVIFIPWDISLYFLTKTVPSILGGWKLDYYNQALSGFIGRSFGTGNLANSLKIILSLIIVFITFFSVFKNKQKDFVSFSLKLGTLITASLIINTFSWQHHFVWLVLPFFATIFTCLKLKKKVLYLLILSISYILVSINFPNPKILPIIFQSHVFFGALILLFLNLHLLQKNKKF